MHHPFALRFYSILALPFLFFIPGGLAQAAASLSVGSISPGTTVSVGSAITFSVSPVGFNSPSFTVSDDFGGGVSSDKINNQGYFSWMPQKSDAGTHNITVSATDASGNSASVTQSFVVVIPSISVTSFVNGPIGYVGMLMTFQIAQTGITNPTYWIGDSVGGSTLTNSRLNAAGALNWVPSTLV
jgi:hypothetical protein